jgi:pyridoxal phosphate enzyme (YggS family)
LNPSARLVAVSKGQDVTKIRALYQRGQREFGENYLQELEEKAEALSDLQDLRWIFVGQLQSNKIQRIVRLAAEIQSVASEKHLRYIDRYARDCGKTPFPVFVEVNIDREAAKSGADESSLPVFLDAASKLEGIKVEGLMAIPAAKWSDEDFFLRGLPPPANYHALRDLADTAGNGKLSLGMSNDFRTALAAGSDCVRIGRSLFGDRR